MACGCKVENGEKHTFVHGSRPGGSSLQWEPHRSAPKQSCASKHEKKLIHGGRLLSQRVFQYFKFYIFVTVLSIVFIAGNRLVAGNPTVLRVAPLYSFVVKPIFHVFMGIWL
jgi:hypothetical protein